LRTDAERLALSTERALGTERLDLLLVLLDRRDLREALAISKEGPHLIYTL